MGLFGSLFEKKNCSVCGGEIKLLGNKKIQDGNLCKDCVKKLSVFFDGYKTSTLVDIQSQLAAREENQRKLLIFEASDSYGEVGRILIDRKLGQFVVLPDCRQNITSISQVIDDNPDVIKFSQIKDIKIREYVTSKEEMKTENGEKVSYNPKHMTYMASFTIVIEVDHPYIESISVPLCDAIHIPCEEPRKGDTEERSFDYLYGFRVNMMNQNAIEEYERFKRMAEEIKTVLRSDPTAVNPADTDFVVQMMKSGVSGEEAIARLKERNGKSSI